MQIAIIGGGLCGLVAGYRLCRAHSVTIFEKESISGGLLSSYRRERYSVERFYHHFFSGDHAFLTLLSDLDLDSSVLWLQGSTGTYNNGSIYPLTTPWEILKYPWLTCGEKVRLGLFMMKARKYDLNRLDLITARDFIIEEMGEELYRKFFLPLLRSKFGQASDSISAAWLVSRVAIRSDRGSGGERLGYLDHGFDRFIQKLTDEITTSGTIRYNTGLKRLSRSGSGWEVNGEPYDLVIITIPPVGLQEYGIHLPDILYQGAACVTLALPREVTNGIYWINLYDPAPYGAVVAHTNFAPYSWYSEHLVYLASYFTGTIPPGLKEDMIRDFCLKFNVQPEEIRWSEIAVDPYAGPLYTTGYARRMKEIAHEGLLFAGMFSPENYPERSIEGSVRAANRIAEVITGVI